MRDKGQTDVSPPASPYENANILSKLFFIYVLPLFYKGYSNVLSDDDIFPTHKKNDAKLLGSKLENAWQLELKSKKNPSLWKALLRMFGHSLIVSGLLYMFIELFVRLSQPLLLSQLLKYYEPNTQITKREAYIYSSGIVASAAISMIFQHQFMLYQFIMGVQIRVATSALVYRKALKLSRSSLGETNIGQMVNLISNDVARFETGIKHIHNLWLAPIEMITIMILLYFYVGPTGMTGVLVLILIIPLQLWLGKKTSIFRLNTAMETDKRIRFMNEIISGIQVIKMYTWERPFAKLVAITRRKEMQYIRKSSLIKGIIVSFQLFINQLSVFSCVLVYVLTGNAVNSQYVYVITSFYNIFRVVISRRFPEAAVAIAETGISVRRIREFLMREEIKDFEDNGILEDNLVVLKNASVKWNNKLEDYSLSNINLSVSSNELAVIIGPVGSGKTTMLYTILKELAPLVGSVEINGKLSYAGQEPFLFLGSIRQNIIFNEKFNQAKYDEVIRVCALERDLILFPYGDRTLVGERGVALSGGQKARINLARAIYRSADIYLLDDPLSAVDTYVGRQIFEECIQGYLKGKCIILVTHQLQYLRGIGKIVLMNEGKVDLIGSYEELQGSNNPFIQVFDKNIDNEISQNEVDVKNEKGDAIKPKHDKGDPKMIEEGRAIGNITWDLYKTFLSYGGNCCKGFLVILLFLGAQALSSGTDYYLSWWVNEEALKKVQHIALSPNSSNSEELGKSILRDIWKEYITENIALIIYSVLLASLTGLVLVRSTYFFIFCVKASIKIHNAMFNHIVYATMRFFNINPSGRILNRFSMDMNQVDETLPTTMIDTIQNGLTAIFTTLVVAVVNPWMLIPTVLMGAIFYFLRKVYMATSRDIKRIESTTRSPIYSHLSTSLQGLTTIRAFGAQLIFRQEFDQHQNKNCAAFVTFLSIGRCFGLWLDMHCVIYIFLVTMSFLFFKTDTLGSFVGLSITQALTLTGQFQWCMRQWTELENTMTSVERIKEYIDVEPENNYNTKDPPGDWPLTGSITFKDLSLRYSSDEPKVLKSLSFTIKSQEKVGIVGRTGAGKSSIIVALFKLAENEGLIAIDGVDISTIPREKLRSSISIIPQEPVLFTGTLRKNLDPFDEFNDETLWNALEEVELKQTVSDLPNGLESRMSEGGSNFSVGQRQLVCLARAIVRSNKILVLDEATANVDPQTDALIQKTIRQKFSNCTVLTIAHRLHTIMDSDKVLVMDAGKVLEFGAPFELLLNEEGVFSGMVEETGKAMAANLHAIAGKTNKGSEE